MEMAHGGCPQPGFCKETLTALLFPYAELDSNDFSLVTTCHGTGLSFFGGRHWFGWHRGWTSVMGWFCSISCHLLMIWNRETPVEEKDALFNTSNIVYLPWSKHKQCIPLHTFAYHRTPSHSIASHCILSHRISLHPAAHVQSRDELPGHS